MRCRRKQQANFDVTAVLMWEWPAVDNETAVVVLESFPEGKYRDSLAMEREEWIRAGRPAWDEWERRKRATR